MYYGISNVWPAEEEDSSGAHEFIVKCAVECLGH